MIADAVTFLILGVLLGIVGFGMIAGIAATVARILFAVFMVLALVSLYRANRAAARVPRLSR